MRKDEFVRRSVNAFEVYDPKKHMNISTFIKSEYLIDVDLFNPWTYQMHLLKGKPLAFLAFDYKIDIDQEHERLNYYILRIAKRLMEPYEEKL